jgi:hypothetical protein
MNEEELEAYLRKHTFNGARREVRDAWMALWHVVVRDIARLLLKILDMLGE